MTNFILNTDSYKTSMWVQYPPKTEYVRAYIEARGISKDFQKQLNTDDPKIVVFGLQAYLKTYIEGVVLTMEDVEEAKDVLSRHGVPFNEGGWIYIVKELGGRLPLRIEALPEGTVTQIGIPMVQVVNTDPKCYWLTSYVETSLLRAIWYPTTVATLSKAVKTEIYRCLELTSDDPDGQIPFKLHDFGSRGVSSSESAGLGGMAHLVNFMGTDTLEAIVDADKLYHEPMAGFSLAASEHSTMTAWGDDDEVGAYRNMLIQFARPGALVAVVSDSYDIYNAVENIWGAELRQEVIDSGATVIIRPDSGNPESVVMECLRSLGRNFGWTRNSKGFKVLNNVRVIQGDGVSYSTISQIMNVMLSEEWSIDNIAFGMGGGLLQKVNRDSLQFAMKTNEICIHGEWKDVYKRPVGDKGKSSKSGEQGVGWSVEAQNYYAYARKHYSKFEPNFLEQVYLDGELLNEVTFEQVRKMAK